MQRRNDTHTSIKNQEKILKQLKIIVFKQKKILQNAKGKPHGCATPLSD